MKSRCSTNGHAVTTTLNEGIQSKRCVFCGRRIWRWSKIEAPIIGAPEQEQIK